MIFYEQEVVLKNIELWFGDCLDLMNNIPDKSIDLILADLPYGSTSCTWDIIIPLDLLWKQYRRLITDIGAIVLFGKQPFTSLLNSSNLEMFKYEWIWIKNSGSDALMAKNKPLSRTENISVFSKGTFGTKSVNRMTYNPQGVIEINKNIKGKNISGKNFVPNRTFKRKSFIQTHTNYPNNILHYKKDGKLHPTQKPVALYEYLIKTYTNEGETVLDIAMGSGTTIEAAERTGRNSIGIEKDEGIFQTAKNRIENIEYE